jgi:recombination protein RecT
MADQKTKPNNTLAEVEKPLQSARFVGSIQKRFNSQAGALTKWSDFHQNLGQRLYIKIEMSLKALNEKRSGDKKITWDKINMDQLAIDATDRVQCELDAQMRNHIHVIPYYDASTGLYKLDLRVGYEGFAYMRQKFALDPSVSVSPLELIYETDIFRRTRVLLAGVGMIEAYDYQVLHEFDSKARGKVVGGFGYISYDNPRKNKIVTVDQRDFARAENSAASKDFWPEGNHREEMQRKTVVFRVWEEVPLDPRRINEAAFGRAMQPLPEFALQRVEQAIETTAQDIADNANTRTLDVPPADQTQVAEEEGP